MLVVCFQDFSVHRIYLEFILHAIGSELQLIDSVIQFILFVGKLRSVQMKLGQYDFLCLLQCNISIFPVVVLVHGHRRRSDPAVLCRNFYLIRHLVDEIIVRIPGTFFQLQHYIPGVSSYCLLKIPGFVDLFHQIANYFPAGFPFIIFVSFRHSHAFFIGALNGLYLSLSVIGDLHLRVYAEEDRSHDLL